MSQHVSKFLTDLIVHFPVRHDGDAAEDAWLQSMFRNLRNYKSSVLDRAAQRIIDTRGDRRFPLPAEIRKVCDEIEKLDRIETAPKFDDAARAKKLQDGHDWQKKLADELIMCSIGKRAAQENWILSLHDFCRLNSRLPTNDYEIRQCIESARGFDRAYEALLRDQGNMMRRPLIDLGDTMLKHREELRVRVLGKEAA
jgi:hypothetical protein